MPAEVADAIEEPVEEEEEDKEKEKGEPQSEIDENGRDVFEGYSFGGNDAESINVMEDELHVATEEAAPVITDAHVRHHPADLSANSLDHDHLRPDPPAKDEDAMSCSDRSVSTRLTNADRDIYMGVSGHSTEPSTATSEAHGKEASADMDSTKPDQPLEAATPSQEIIEPVAEIPEDEDWDVVEQEIQVAQNGRTVEGRRGLGKTLFQKGVPDRCWLLFFNIRHNAHDCFLRCVGRQGCCSPDAKTYGIFPPEGTYHDKKSLLSFFFDRR